MSLTDPPPGDHGAQALGRVVKCGKASSLQQLGLNNDDISDRGALEIADAMLSPHCPPKLKISLLGNQGITSIGRNALEDATRRSGEDIRAVAVTEKNMLDRQPSRES